VRRPPLLEGCVRTQTRGAPGKSRILLASRMYVKEGRIIEIKKRGVKVFDTLALDTLLARLSCQQLTLNVHMKVRVDGSPCEDEQGWIT
jgi:hypothetical protein